MSSSSLQHHAALWSGVAAVAWVGAQYAGGQHLGLFITLLILAFYLVGAVELHRERHATAGLADNLRALKDTPSDLSAWLLTVPGGLQSAVRQRIESGTGALPHASLTTYLVGLLVLLGMLGTFLGMVVTLNGTGSALQASTDPQAIRGSLAGPVKGLGLAFGTSVAGVAASAMLGLMAALSRRDRSRVQHLLDRKIASTLRTFSPSFQREQSLRLLHQQGESLPLIVERLSALMESIDDRTVRLHERLQTSQVQANEQLQQSLNDLAVSVRETFEHGVAQMALTTCETLRPTAESTLTAVSLHAQEMSRTLTEAFIEQLREQSNLFSETVSEAARRHTASMEQQDRVLEETFRRVGGLLDLKLEAVQQMLTSTVSDMERLHSASTQQSALILDGVSRDSAELLQRHTEQVAEQVERLVTRQTESEQRRESEITRRIADQTTALQHQWQQLARESAAQQSALVTTLERASRVLQEQTLAQTTGVLEKMEELTLASSESSSLARKALVEVQEALAARMAQDKASFLEHRKVMDALNLLLETTTAAAHEQRSAMEALASSAADTLTASLEELRAQSERESARLDSVTAEVSASAVEVASLGEAFGAAVEEFSHSSGELTKQLERVEAALSRSLTRSDEQLAYYVAQAREVIDLSLLSQKQIMEDLQRLGEGHRGARLVDAGA